MAPIPQCSAEESISSPSWSVGVTISLYRKYPGDFEEMEEKK